MGHYTTYRAFTLTRIIRHHKTHGASRKAFPTLLFFGRQQYTSNAGRNWKALVQETIDATLNRVSSSGVSGASYFTGSILPSIRDRSGNYLAVSSRGNFYLTWRPGDDFWTPHNRNTARRIQGMGYVNGDVRNGLWMSLNGGGLQRL